MQARAPVATEALTDGGNGVHSLAQHQVVQGSRFPTAVQANLRQQRVVGAKGVARSAGAGAFDAPTARGGALPCGRTARTALRPCSGDQGQAKRGHPVVRSALGDGVARTFGECAGRAAGLQRNGDFWCRSSAAEPMTPPEQGTLRAE